MSRRRQQTAVWAGTTAGPFRGMGRWHVSRGERGTGETLLGSRVGERPWVRGRKAESARSWEGVRGVHSTEEGVQDNAPEGRSPALIEPGRGEVRGHAGNGQKPH